MSTPISFRLLHLPNLAFREVIVQINWTEILAIAFCSQKAFCFIKSLRLKLPKPCLFPGLRSQEMIIGTDNYFAKFDTSQSLISIRALEDVEDDFCLVKIGGHQVKLSTQYSMWETFWEDMALGLEQALEWLYDLFQVNFHRIMITKTYLPVFNLMNNRQNTAVKYGAVKSDGWLLTKENLQFILTNFHVEHLEIEDSINSDTTLPDNFTPWPYKNLKIVHGSWLRVEDFLILAKFCEEIEITNTVLTEVNVNTILQNWIEGEMPNLKFFEIGLRRKVTPPNIATILKGLDQSLITFTGEKHYGTHQQIVWIFRTGQGLQSNDGVTASYHLNNECFCLAVCQEN